MTCPFTYLGLPTSASEEEVKTAYRKLAMKVHPDRGGSHEAFVELDRQYKLALSRVAAGAASRTTARDFDEEIIKRTATKMRQEAWNKELEALIKKRAKKKVEQNRYYPPDEQQFTEKEWKRAYDNLHTKEPGKSCTACDDIGYIDINNGVKTLHMRCPTCLGGTR